MKLIKSASPHLTQALKRFDIELRESYEAPLSWIEEQLFRRGITYTFYSNDGYETFFSFSRLDISFDRWTADKHTADVRTMHHKFHLPHLKEGYQLHLVDEEGNFCLTHNEWNGTVYIHESEFVDYLHKFIKD